MSLHVSMSLIDQYLLFGFQVKGDLHDTGKTGTKAIQHFLRSSQIL